MVESPIHSKIYQSSTSLDIPDNYTEYKTLLNVKSGGVGRGGCSSLGTPF